MLLRLGYRPWEIDRLTPAETLDILDAHHGPTPGTGDVEALIRTLEARDAQAGT